MATQDMSAMLKDVTVEGVISLDIELGRGAFGRVFSVKYHGLVCAAKKIHPILIETVSPAERKAIIDNFIRECHQCSVISHPNIVQFLGVYYATKKSDLPIMVMELMDTSLTSFVNNNKDKIPMKTKMSILHDVSLGLSYFHARKPVVIHRYLSPNNVMLTSQPVAKIGDLGVAKVIRADSRQTRSRLTTAPGTVDFMPPETFEANPVYGTAVDIFSFAGLALHVFAEEWPTPCNLKIQDPVTKRLMALTEAERRQEYLNKIPEGVSVLKDYFVRCLDDEPEERPPIQEVSEIIQALKQSESSDDHTRKKTVSLFVPPRSKQKEHYVAPTRPVKKSEESPTFAEALQSHQYHINWTSCSDLACKLYSASVAVSTAGDTVYVTAGSAPDDNTLNNVYCYNTNTDHWTVLPQPGHRFGVLHMLDDRLTIFGGSDAVTRKYLNKVTTYSYDINRWYTHYPNMLNSRFRPGVITYNDYVIVMGGKSSPGNILDTIEIMNFHEEQLEWKIIPVHLPVPMLAIKPTISADNIIIVGYSHAGGRNKGYYQIAIEDITTSLHQPPSTSATSNHWKKMSPATHFDTVTVPYISPPVIIGGSSHANEGCVPTSDVSLYDVSKNSWVKVDALTSSRDFVGVGLLYNNSIIIIGGSSGGEGVEANMASSLTTVEIGNIVPNQ